MNKTLALLLGFSFTGLVGAGDAAVWLERMDQAAKSLNYQGDFVFLRGDQMRQMQALHLVDEAGEHVRITAVDGPPVQVLAHSGQVTVGEQGRFKTLPGSRDVLFSAVLPQRLLALRSLYSVSLGAVDRVADRPTQIVEVQPRDGFRFGFRLWADIDQGLLLKAVMVNPQGTAVEQFSFSRIDLNPDSDQRVASADQATIDSGSVETAAPAFSPAWEVTEIPQGFALQSTNQYTDEHQVPIDHLLFSDGLATVSVFVEPLRDDHSAVNRATNMGGVSAVMGAVSHRQVTVMGEVPAATLSLILNSVKPVESNPGD